MSAQKSSQWPHLPLYWYARVRSISLATFLFLSAVAAGPAVAQAATSAHSMQSSENEATLAVDAFMTALESNQLEAARQAMTPNAVVIANGTVLGTRDGYIDGAAKADAAAMKSVRSRELVHRDSQVGAQLAWVVSEKRMLGDAAGQMRALVLTETFLLAKTSSGWKISGIHWSSRAAS